MDREQLEFLISQYSEGSLSADERAKVETILSTDETARALLEEYRKLDAKFAGIGAVPSVDFAALRDGISDDIDALEQAEAQSVAGSIHWPMRVAMAAMILVLIGVGVVLSLKQQLQTGAPSGNGFAAVSGPSVEVASGPAVAKVEIVEPAEAQLPAFLRYADMQIERPGRVSIAADVATPSEDKKPH